METLRAQGMYPETVAIADEAIAIAPEVALFHLARAIGLLAVGDAHESERAVRRALVLDDTQAWAHSQLSLSLVQQGRHAEAVVSAQRAVELLPEAPALHQRFAQALLGAGATEEAVRGGAAAGS
jgi:tetratricopeptide (TPR) repeat protein